MCLSHVWILKQIHVSHMFAVSFHNANHFPFRHARLPLSYVSTFLTSLEMIWSVVCVLDTTLVGFVDIFGSVRAFGTSSCVVPAS